MRLITDCRLNKRFQEWEIEIIRVFKRVEALENALRPFIENFNLITNGNEKDHYPISGGHGIKVGHMRRAMELLGEDETVVEEKEQNAN